MKQIKNPQNKTYYFIKSPVDNTLQEGWVDSEMVLSTPDYNIIHQNENRLNVIPNMEAEIGPQTAFNDLLTLDEENGVYCWGRGFCEHETFFIFADQSVAEPLSRALYSVVNPGQEGMYARVYHHPNGEAEYSVMEFREQDVIPISLGADATPIAEALAITVEEGALTQEEVDGIVGAISTYAGQEVRLKDFIPASWADKQIDKHMAMDMGYNVQNSPTYNPNNLPE